MRKSQQRDRLRDIVLETTGSVGDCHSWSAWWPASGNPHSLGHGRRDCQPEMQNHQHSNHQYLWHAEIRWNWGTSESSMECHSRSVHLRSKNIYTTTLPVLPQSYKTFRWPPRIHPLKSSQNRPVSIPHFPLAHNGHHSMTIHRHMRNIPPNPDTIVHTSLHTDLPLPLLWWLCEGVTLEVIIDLPGWMSSGNVGILVFID